MTRRINFGVLGFCSLLSFVCLSAQAERGPVIEEIEGDKIVVVKTPEGTKVGTRGSEIRVGDRIKTGPHASAKIRFADGSKMLIGKGTEMEVRPPTQGVMTTDLLDGEVRTLVKKPKINDPSAGKLPKFMIRTKSAVLGVRGTDFVSSVGGSADKAGELKMHTLEGAVEVARDEATLFAGKGQVVRQNQFVKANEGSIDAPQNFVRDEYIKSLSQSQPDFVALTRHDHDFVNESQAVSPLDPPTIRRRLRLFSFQVGGLFVSQSTGGSVFTSQMSWNPTIRLLDPLDLRLHVGGYPLKTRSVGKAATFFGYELGGLLSLRVVDPLIIEAGVLMTGWTNTEAPLALAATAGLAYRLSDDSFLERLFVSGAIARLEVVPTGAADQSDTQVLLIKAGVGFQF